MVDHIHVWITATAVGASLALAVLGHVAKINCASGVGPSVFWYFTTLCITLHPFVVLRNVHETKHDGFLKRRLCAKPTFSCLVAAAALASLEGGTLLLLKPLYGRATAVVVSRAVGTTAHLLFGVAGIALAFYKSEISIPTRVKAHLYVAARKALDERLTPRALQQRPARRGKISEEEAYAARLSVASNKFVDYVSETTSRMLGRGKVSLLRGGSFALRSADGRRRAPSDLVNLGSALWLLVTVASIWLKVFLPNTTYVDKYWAISACAVVPFLVLAVALDWKAQLKFSFAYMTFYAIVGLRAPDYLGYAAVYTFNSLGNRFETNVMEIAPREFSKEFLMKYFISVGYMALMTSFLFLLQRVVSSMSSEALAPRFLFHVQLYYYMFFYVLLSSDAIHIDFFFWLLVLTMNAHYSMRNAGVYERLLMRLLRKMKFYSSSSVTSKASSIDHTFYTLRMANQDTLADSISLLVVPSMITAFVGLSLRDAYSNTSKHDIEKRVSLVENVLSEDLTRVVDVRTKDGSVLDLYWLWMRFLIMWIARTVSARLVVWYLKSLHKHEDKRVADRVSARSLLDSSRVELEHKKISNITSMQARAAADLLAKQQGLKLDIRGGDGRGGSGDDEEDVEMVSQFSEELLPPAQAMARASNVETHEAFDYFVFVSVAVAFSVFQNPSLPTRFGFCSVVSYH